MQGRLSPLVDDRIQAFPWKHWHEEFALAQQCGFQLMEWTLDQERLYENPLMTEVGQAEIKALIEEYQLRIPSLTGDCFMQAPFWKASGIECEALQRDFQAIAKACYAVGIAIIVVPLVDNGRLENNAQENDLVSFLQSQIQFLSEHNLRVAFECDFSPMELARFINRLDSAVFGINYDIGNSASLGFNSQEEFSAYGERIINVHVKDRLLGGTTVALGLGDANFKVVFSELAKINYSGNYILQTARATDNKHAEVLCQYRDTTKNWISQYAA